MNTRVSVETLSPTELVKRLSEQITAHPNAKLLVSSPSDESDYVFCHVFDVGYEPEIGFLEHKYLDYTETFWSKDEYFYDYGEDTNPEEVPEFNEYIILWCE